MSSSATASIVPAIPAFRANSASPTSSRKAAKASASASASSSRAPRSSSDPFYGHEETAVMSARFKRYPAARGSSGHRLFISAFMIASKVICDDTYSNQSWGIVAQKMFALKEINQMEREMCGYLEWNLNVAGDEVIGFEERIRSEHGPRPTARGAPSPPSSASSETSTSLSQPTRSYPTPETTPDSSLRPIRPVPSPHKARSHPRNSISAFPSPASSPSAQHLSPQPPHFTTSANSSLASSPASDDCKTPSPVTMTSRKSASRASSHYKPTSIDMTRAFESRARSHAVDMHLSGEPISVGSGW